MTTGMAGTKPARAAAYARRNALRKSIGYCAKYVRTAFQQYYSNFVQTSSAYKYHTNTVLKRNGFTQIDPDTTLQVGDIYVINRFGSHKYGHIAVWDGRNWVSDFVQKSSNVYGGRVVEFVLYRDNNFLNGAKPASGWVSRRFLQPNVGKQIVEVAVASVQDETNDPLDNPLAMQPLRSSRKITLSTSNSVTGPSVTSIIAYSSVEPEALDGYFNMNPLVSPLLHATMREVARKLNPGLGSTDLRRFIAKDKQLILTPTVRKKLAAEINFILKTDAEKLNFLVNKVRVNKQYEVKTVTATGNRKAWADATFAQVQKRGSADLKSFIRTADDVVQILNIEESRNPMPVNVVNSGGFMGPFQVGMAAWLDGPADFSPYPRNINGNVLRQATRARQKGTPADIDVMAPGIVVYWNKSLAGFKQALNKLGAGYKFNRLPRNWKLLYFIHNQGAGGAASILAGKRKIAGNQSKLAIAIYNEMREL